MAWFKGLAAAQRIAMGIIAALMLIWAAWFVYDLLTASDKVKGRLGETQTEAAIASGKEATQTVGKQGETETTRNQSTKDMQDEVNKAETDSTAHAAGSSFLCDNFGICGEE